MEQLQAELELCRSERAEEVCQAAELLHVATNTIRQHESRVQQGEAALQAG